MLLADTQQGVIYSNFLQILTGFDMSVDYSSCLSLCFCNSFHVSLFGMIMILTVCLFFLYFSCLPMLASPSVPLSYTFCFILWLSVCLSVCHFFVVSIFLSVNQSFSDISLSVCLSDTPSLWFTVFVLRVFMIPQLLPVVSLPEVTINFTII